MVIEPRKRPEARSVSIPRERQCRLVGEATDRDPGPAGDAVLAEFHSVIDSVNCALQFQREMARRNAAQTDQEHLNFRIGINLGEVIHDRGDIYGDGVNISARIQEIAEPGGINISHAAYEQVRGKIECQFNDLGYQKLKNIEHPIHTFRVKIFKSHQPVFTISSIH